MTIIQSCDHHDEHGSIPDNRSRKRMLLQLNRATQLSDALADLYKGSMRYDIQAGRPVTIIPLEELVGLYEAWLAWLQVSPSGDDWHPPYEPPSEIRVPDLDSAPAAEAEPAPDATNVAGDTGTSVHDPKPPAADPS